MAENWHCQTNFGGSLLYQISVMSAKHFMRDKKSPFMALCKQGTV
jgi:hypothetical protein